MTPGEIEERLCERVDTDLLARSQRGDARAYDELARVHWEWLLRKIERRFFQDTGCRMGSGAADLVQSAFEKAWSHVGSFDEGKGCYHGWLYTIASNLGRDLLRSELRRPSEREGDALIEVVPDDSHYGDPERAVERAELERTVRECLSRLPTSYQQVLY